MDNDQTSGSNGDWGALDSDPQREAWDSYAYIPEPGENRPLDSFLSSKNLDHAALVRLGARMASPNVVAVAFEGGIKYRDVVTGKRWSFIDSTFRALKIIPGSDRTRAIICEGETDAARLSMLYTCDVAVMPAGATNWRPEYTEQVSHYRQLFVGLDNDAPNTRGHKAGEQGWLKIEAAVGPRAVRFAPPDDPGDWCDLNGGPPPTLPEPLTDAEYERLVSATAQLDADEPAQAELLCRLGTRAELFATLEGEYCATFETRGHAETWAIRSAQFRGWLAREFRALRHQPPTPTATETAVAQLQAIAMEDEARHELHVRVARHEGNLYIDLGDADWRVVEVTPRGWTVIERPPIKFRRPRGQQPLPVPERGGSIEALRPVLNIGGDDNWTLIVAWILAAFNPSADSPILTLHGEAGAAKSTTTRLLRQITDPAATASRSAPRDERDLAVAARNNRVVAFDNLSRLQPWLSDALARLATGAGFATRALYTDGEEFQSQAKRPIILNGIAELATRGDLLSRCLLVELPRIEVADRKEAAEVDAALARVQPSVFGAILDALSYALAHPKRLAKLPRMSDFAAWIESAAPALGWSDGEFLDAYERNQGQAIEVELEASPLSAPIRQLVASHGTWTGTNGELLEVLRDLNPTAALNPQGWPKSPRGMSSALRLLAPTLRLSGIEVEQGDHLRAGKGGARQVRLSARSAE